MIKILVFLVCLAFGILMIIKTESFVRFTGEIGWAERHLGGAGTFTLYKLIGFGIILFGMSYSTGLFQKMTVGLVQSLFGGFGSEPAPE